MTRFQRLRGVVVAATTALVVTGCGGLAPAHSGAPRALPPSDHLSIADFAVRVLAATVSARSVHAQRVETAHGERTEMTGDTLFDTGSYRGRLTLNTILEGTAKGAATEKGELRLVGGRVYMHVPGMVPTGKFLSLDLDAGTPEVGGLCACLFSHVEPTTTLQNMRRSLTKVDYLGREKRAGLFVEHYRLEADTSMIPGAADETDSPTTRIYQVWLDSKHLMRRMTYSTPDKTVNVTYSHWGERVHVERPATKQILRAPGTSATGT